MKKLALMFFLVLGTMTIQAQELTLMRRRLAMVGEVEWWRRRKLEQERPSEIGSRVSRP